MHREAYSGNRPSNSDLAYTVCLALIRHKQRHKYVTIATLRHIDV